MKVRIEEGECIVTREPGDPKFSGIRNAAGESRLLYHIKRILNARGFNLVKVHMAKDGNLVDDMQQYLRPAGLHPTSDKANIAIYNVYWAIQGADEILNEDGEGSLTVVPDFCEKRPLPAVQAVGNRR